ncbi:lysylphosphatidylglycerol synthase domain-containing protein, partial [Hungatella hathewayi]|uniref:lysylphosphatidylglycerol synthase transmembrane domain-containing protein n=1 Tax=Hungatella hathewayi TaxID=154046 RepID=UPI0026E2D45A
VLRLLNHIPSFDGEKAAQKAGSMIEEYSQGGAYLRKYPMAAVKTAVLTFCQLTFLYMASYCACLALGLGSVGLVNFIMLQSIVSLAVSAVPLPGAVGASESGFLVMFGGFLSSSQLLPVMVLSRGISFYGFLVVSGLAVASLHIGKKGTPKKEKEVRSRARGPMHKQFNVSADPR